MKETAYAVAGLVVLAAIYVGSYCAMVVPDGFAIDEDHIIPEYRFGGKTAHVVYRPVYEIDRRVRPERWPGFLRLPDVPEMPDVRRPEERDDAP